MRGYTNQSSLTIRSNMIKLITLAINTANKKDFIVDK
jgi:hypothetical protein